MSRVSSESSSGGGIKLTKLETNQSSQVAAFHHQPERPVEFETSFAVTTWLQCLTQQALGKFAQAAATRDITYHWLHGDELLDETLEHASSRPAGNSLTGHDADD